LIQIAIAPHPLFQRRGDDILLDLPITLSEAVLGAKVRTPTPTGPVMLNVPKASNTGAVLRLKGKGVRRRGDALVTLKIVLPPQPDAALQEFAAKWPGKDYDPRKDWP
jgi:DnaJ-class molecular chaperone